MRVIIAGSRNIYPATTWIDRIVVESGFIPTLVLCGCSKGVDQSGLKWAEWKDIPVQKYPAHWKTFGVTAGPRRNDQMAKEAEALILLWNGMSRGSANMKRIAEARGLKIYEVIWRGEEGR